MSSHAFSAGLGAWWRGDPEPNRREDREGSNGWRQAALSAQDGPLGVFNIYRREYPLGEACRFVRVGQVLANNQRDALTVAFVMWPLSVRRQIDARRSGFDGYERTGG